MSCEPKFLALPGGNWSVQCGHFMTRPYSLIWDAEKEWDDLHEALTLLDEQSQEIAASYGVVTA